jgi:sulfite exporter TauE/SafE/copper chaperone CopZ
MLKQNSLFTTSTYYIQGMHCASCEILIEKRIIKEETVEMVDVSLAKGTVTIEYKTAQKVTPELLNKIFKEEGYKFADQPFKKSTKIAMGGHCALPNETPNNPATPFLIAGIFVLGYIFLSKTGLSTLISVNSQSSLPLFFLFGLLAGVSSCAALVGGIILSMSKQWMSKYDGSNSTLEKAEPHLLFNTGRVLGYAGFGAILGMTGNFFKLSPTLTAGMIIAISLIMVLLGLQMLGVKALQNWQIRLPKSITGKMADEENFQGKFGPFLMGALTFFLPCGFTITAQALALASGNPIQGALIMGLFALGTVPGLLAIGLSSVKLQSNPRHAKQFSMVAGSLVLFFAAFNINAQLAVLGVNYASDFVSSQVKTQTTQTASELPQIVNGKQVVKMNVSGGGYSPNKITIRAGVPVAWEITSDSNPGCASTIISRSLFTDSVYVAPNTTVTKEFTAPTPGTYRFSCSMGMYTGTIIVVDDKGSAGTVVETAPAKTGGCGCGH